MADQNSNVPFNQDIAQAISNAEQLLMNDDENHDDLILLDDLVNGMVEDFTANVFRNNGTEFPEVCPPENTSNDQNRDHTNIPSSSGFGNPIPIPVWPVPPAPYSCSCCQTLREFFHVNGNHVTKLHVHGMLGVISHAVMEKYSINVAPQDHEYQMFDFCHESISNVRQFLVRYCDDRRREGYTMLQDPLFYFYEALCAGLYANGTPHVYASPQQQAKGKEPMNQEEGYPNQQQEEEDDEDDEEEEEEEGNEEREPRSHIAAQRERAARMTLNDLTGYFHLPIQVAASELNLCSSAIKGICRRYNIDRWPYRKINSIQSKISKKQERLNSDDPNERAQVLTEIQSLEQKLANLYEEYRGQAL